MAKAELGLARAEEAIRRDKAIAVLRGEFEWAGLQRIAETMLANHLHVLEYTLTSPGALEGIGRLREAYGGDLIVGVGTAATAEDCLAAYRAGADFIVAPHFTVDLPGAEVAGRCLFIPGVFSPSEAHMARQSGWGLQKLFPAATGGPGHLKNLRGPYPDLSFIPTGGISEENARDYMEAGAVAVGIGSSMFSPRISRAELEHRLGLLVASLRGDRTS